MPQPRPYKVQRKRQWLLNGVVDAETINIVTEGRVQWNGVQRRRKHSRVMPPTTMNSMIRTYNKSVYKRSLGNGFELVGDPAFVFSNHPRVTSRSQTSAGENEEALSRAVAAFSKEAGLGETLIELPSSLRLVSRRTSTIFQILYLAGRGRFRDAGLRLKEVTGYNVSNRSVKRLERRWGSERTSYDSRRASSFWLEYHFGFVPLLQSVFDSVDAFASTEQVRSKRGRSGTATYHIYGEVVNRREYDAARLGLLNPAAVAWDLVPFSFVIDWFLPIGLILRYLGADRGLKTVYACRTSQRTIKYTYNGILDFSEDYYYRTVMPPPTIGEVFNASSRSHGFWTVITVLSLVNTLR